ncbi:MAG: hypothetical protein RSF82_06940 [Angelakisella sp.]
MICGIMTVCVLAVIFLMGFEKWRIMNITSEASRKVTATIVSLSSSHLSDSYSPIRDATSGAFVFDGNAFEEIKDTTSFYSMFAKLHDHTSTNGNSLKGGVSSDGYLYEISDVSVMVNNAGATGGKTIYRVMYTLTVPQDLLWRSRAITLPRQVQTVEYMNKY